MIRVERRSTAHGRGVGPLLLLSGMLVGACAGAPSGSTGASHDSRTGAGLSHTKESTLALVDVSPSSRSLIQRATHIMLIRIMTVEERQWMPRESGGEERAVTLELRLDEVIKGRLVQAAGQTVRVEAKQVRFGEAWGRMPGVWSNVQVESGVRLAGFGVTDRTDAAAVLNDPAAVELVAIESALPDLHLAARAPQTSLPELLAAAREESGSLGYLFADYLWAAYGSEAMTHFPTFDAILTAMEWPELNTVARSTWLMSIPDTVLAVEPPATRHIDRLAASMVRLLSMPAAKTLHDNIAATFLPNLVDAESDDSRPPAEVLSNYPDDLARLAEVATAYASNKTAAAFVTWANRR